VACDKLMEEMNEEEAISGDDDPIEGSSVCIVIT
jgi:hypothetical protein